MVKYTKKRRSFPKRYIPKQLTRKDKKKQADEINKSRSFYENGKYYKRKTLKSFKNKPSNHVNTAKEIYKINSIAPSKELSKATQCSLACLKAIESKGQGAYYSSGSRPNQTAHSWGIARVASSITGGKSSAVDFSILSRGCQASSPALKMASKAKKKYNYGQRRVPKTEIV